MNEIEEWGKEDGIKTDKINCYYFPLGYDYLGLTKFKWIDGEKGACIQINDLIFWRCRWVEKGVLWHEYCHYLEWVAYDNTGHDRYWLRLMIRKPGLCLLDLIAKLIWPFVNIKRNRTDYQNAPSL